MPADQDSRWEAEETAAHRENAPAGSVHLPSHSYDAARQSELSIAGKHLCSDEGEGRRARDGQTNTMTVWMLKVAPMSLCVHALRRGYHLRQRRLEAAGRVTIAASLRDRISRSTGGNTVALPPRRAELPVWTTPWKEIARTSAGKATTIRPQRRYAWRSTSP